MTQTNQPSKFDNPLLQPLFQHLGLLHTMRNMLSPTDTAKIADIEAQIDQVHQRMCDIEPECAQLEIRRSK
jgi:hypothetical protein